MIKVHPAEQYTLKQIPEKGITLTGLAKLLSVHVTTMDKRINKLELKGLITVDRHHDGNSIKLTKMGEKLV